MYSKILLVNNEIIKLNKLVVGVTLLNCRASLINSSMSRHFIFGVINNKIRL